MAGKISTGIRGLDDLIEGGFPEGRVVLIVGGPGTGKTILCGQFLYNGIYGANENGIFVSLDEGKTHFMNEMKQFGWDFAKAESERKFEFIDATRIPRVSQLKEQLFKEESSSLRGKQLPIDELIQRIQSAIMSRKAKRVVIDTLAALMYRFSDPVERRNATLDLIEALASLGVTSLVTTELLQFGLERHALEEEFLVHGVIMMQTLFEQGTTTRALQVEKMREAKVNTNIVPYSIDKNGIEVFPNLPLFGKQ